MKRFTAVILTMILAFAGVANVSAQTSDSIWLTADTTSYKTRETVTVMLNAVTGTPIQGFTFQVRYDPACLQPVDASSPITGMNGLPLPQISGLVDGSYASTTPQTVNGILAEIRFVTLGGCQTNLILESAALAIRNADGFAAPLAGVAIGEKNIALTIDKEAVTSQPAETPSGSVLPLNAPLADTKPSSGWSIGLLAIAVMAGIGFGVSRLFRTKSGTVAKAHASSRSATLHMKHGTLTGKSFVLNKLPCLIGRDPQSDICIHDAHVINQHARIFTANNVYYLMDLGGETFVNGHAIRRSSAILKPGDVVRLGKSALFVFG